jgi:DNA (cytosine-5)-methyltransferase 1
MKIERGLIKPKKELLGRIAKHLDVNLEELFTGQSNLYNNSVTGEGYVTAKPENIVSIPRKRAVDPTKRSIVDLFCGVGGFSFGFENTGAFEVVAGIDLLQDRLQTFSQNHSAANSYGQDIRTISPTVLDEENPRPHVIVGGPPCQGFSSIRPFRNTGKSDNRNTLFEEFCRLVKELEPEWLVFENVVGLLTHERGAVLKAILEAFENVGYRISHKVLNAAYYGLPQRRERLIIVGNRKGKAYKWPEPTHRCNHRSMAGGTSLVHKPLGELFATQLLDEATTIEQAIFDLPPLNSGENSSSYRNDIELSPYQEFIRNNCNELTLHEATAHSRQMLEIIRHSGPNIYALPPGMVKSGFSSAYSRLAGDEPSVTLTVNFVHPASNRCIHPTQDRALTPREGARLQ